jgi:hypothetical protein
MVLNQVLGPRFAVGLVALLAVGGCSSSASRHAEHSTTASSTVAAAPEAAAAEPEQTATEAAVASGAAPAPAAAEAPTAAVVNPTAPKSYTVKRGDTLWGIASMFLKDPWLWPEVWYVNPQVANPHLIYPGDTLALAFSSEGRPQIRLESGGPARLDPRLRSSPLEAAIPTIPYSAIAAFLTRPTVVTADEIRSAPYILAFRDEHVAGGAGHEVYVRNLKASQNDRFTVVHVGDELRDPDDGKVVGYMGIYTATALVSKPGDPAKAVLTDTARETLQGDRLLSVDTGAPANFVLRSPAHEVNGRIISVVDGTQLIGQYQVVVINRGKRHGIDAGDVLAVDTAGAVVPDRERAGSWGRTFGTSFAPKVRLPDERAGTILVFRSFERVSYALVVGASNTLHVGDVVRNP